MGIVRWGRRSDGDDPSLAALNARGRWPKIIENVRGVDGAQERAVNGEVQQLSSWLQPGRERTEMIPWKTERT